MPANDRGGLKAAFANFSKVEAEKEAERRLLGREIRKFWESYHTATS